LRLSIYIYIYCWGVEVKDDEPGGASGTCRGERNHFCGFGGKGGQLEDLRFDGYYINNVEWRGLISSGSGKG
jgi:hypothetical protein